MNTSYFEKNVDSWLFFNYNYKSFYKRGNWTINQTF